MTDETGKLTIDTNAVVEIPEAEKASAIAVSQHPFNQEEIDRITVTFLRMQRFIQVPVIYQNKTAGSERADYLEGISAEGNMDPNGWGKDENEIIIWIFIR